MEYEFIPLQGGGYTTTPLQTRGDPILKAPANNFNVVFVAATMSAPAHFKLDPSSVEIALPAKMFDKDQVDYLTSKAIDLYKDNLHTTSGVLFTGNYGSGKSVTMRNIELAFMELGLPVVRILEYPKDEMHLLKRFLGTLGDKLIVIDEFEKKFENYQQEELLDLFDGESTAPGTCIMLGVNRVAGIDNGFIKRPGRVGLWFTSTFCSRKVLNEVTSYMLKDVNHINDITEWYDSFDGVTIDEVLSVVKARKRYPKDKFTDLLSVLNVSKSYGYRTFKVVAIEAKVYDDDADTLLGEAALTAKDELKLDRVDMVSNYANSTINLAKLLKKKSINDFKDLTDIDLSKHEVEITTGTLRNVSGNKSSIGTRMYCPDPADAAKTLRVYFKLTVTEQY